MPVSLPVPENLRWLFCFVPTADEWWAEYKLTRGSRNLAKVFAETYQTEKDKESFLVWNQQIEYIEEYGRALGYVE